MQGALKFSAVEVWVFKPRTPNFCVKCDKHPADYCSLFDDSEVLSAFDFRVGACALRG